MRIPTVFTATPVSYNSLQPTSYTRPSLPPFVNAADSLSIRFGQQGKPFFMETEKIPEANRKIREWCEESFLAPTKSNRTRAEVGQPSGDGFFTVVYLQPYHRQALKAKRFPFYETLPLSLES